ADRQPVLLIDRDVALEDLLAGPGVNREGEALPILLADAVRAANPARLVEQPARLLGIVRIAQLRRDLLGLVRPGEGREDADGDGGQAVADALHDPLAVDGAAERLADADVLEERRLRRIELELEDEPAERIVGEDVEVWLTPRVIDELGRDRDERDVDLA